MLNFDECVFLLKRCVEAGLLQRDEVIPDNILVYRSGSRSIEPQWYSENLFTVAKELMSDEAGQQFIQKQLQERRG